MIGASDVRPLEFYPDGKVKYTGDHVTVCVPVYVYNQPPKQYPALVLGEHAETNWRPYMLDLQFQSSDGVQHKVAWVLEGESATHKPGSSQYQSGSPWFIGPVVKGQEQPDA